MASKGKKAAGVKAPKAKPTKAVAMVNGTSAAIAVVDGDISIPIELRRTGPRLTDAQIKKLVDTPPVVWTRLADRPVKESVGATALMVEDRTAPVEVHRARGKDRELVKRYANADEFEKEHDYKKYPVNKVMSTHELTIVSVNAKPWADRAVNPDAQPRAPRVRKAKSIEPRTPKQRADKLLGVFDKDAPPRKKRETKDYSQTGTGKPVRASSSLGKILSLLMAGKHTMEQIVALSGVENGDVISAEDKVMHRIRFVLWGKHGVGHAVDDKGIVTGKLPAGFTIETMLE